jgi:D-cysteine desulfhydrase
VNRKIREALGACSLGHWPTPLEFAPELAAAVGAAQLWLKREDRSSPRYGGNKVRGLEFLLAGVPRGTVLVTVGGTGSTHCLATAVHGVAAGCRVVLAQFPQPETATATAIARACRDAGAVVCRANSRAGFPLTLARAWLAAGRLGPRHWIPGGGAHPVAVVGHFLAGLELASQLTEPPDAIVVPLGSTGTAAGLCLAVAHLRWPTRVVGVRVAPWIVANGWRAASLARRARLLLLDLDASISIPHSATGRESFRALRAPHSFLVVDGLGKGYGYATAAGERARQLAAQHGLALDSTYGAKAFAAVTGLVARGFRRLGFWHTFAAP